MSRQLLVFYGAVSFVVCGPIALAKQLVKLYL